MDFPSSIPRKQKFQHRRNNSNPPRKSVNGRAIVPVPSEKSNYTYDLSNDEHQVDCTSYRGTNDHINAMNNPGDGSDSSSHFSGGREQKNDAERKVAKKRQQTKEMLAESQRKRETQRLTQGGFTIDGAYEHASGGTKPKCFDGVQIDGPATKEAAKIVENARDELTVARVTILRLLLIWEDLERSAVGGRSNMIIHRFGPPISLLQTMRIHWKWQYIDRGRTVPHLGGHIAAMNLQNKWEVP